MSRVHSWATVLSRIPSLAQRLNVWHAVTIRFQLNKHASESVQKLKDISLSQYYGALPKPYYNTGTQVELNFRDKPGLSAKQKRTAITQLQEESVFKDLTNLFDKWHWQYHHPVLLFDVPGSNMPLFGVTDYSVARSLWKSHETVRNDYYRKKQEIKKAKAKAVEDAARVKLREEVKEKVKQSIKERLRGHLRVTLMQEVSEQLREELREELKEELRAEAEVVQHGL